MNKFSFVIYTIYLIILLTNIKTSQAARNAKFRTATNRWSTKYFSNFTVYTKNDSIFCDMVIIKPLESGFKANVEFQIRLKNSKQYQTLFAYNFDVCNIVIAYKDTIFKRWFKSLLRYGNFMQNCPVNVGHYYLNGWKLDSSLIPSYLYPGDYRIKGYGYYGKFKGKNEDFVVDIVFDTIID